MEYEVSNIITDSKVCFGYALEEVISEISRSNPENLKSDLNLFAYGHGVCTDGTTHNFDGSSPSCEGSVNRNY